MGYSKISEVMIDHLMDFRDDLIYGMVIKERRRNRIRDTQR